MSLCAGCCETPFHGVARKSPSVGEPQQRTDPVLELWFVELRSCLCFWHRVRRTKGQCLRGALVFGGAQLLWWCARVVFFMQQAWEFLLFGDELHKLLAPAFTSLRIWEKPAFGNVETRRSCQPRWDHSLPCSLGPQPPFRAVSDAKGCSFCFFSFHHIWEVYPVPYQQPCCCRARVQLLPCCSWLSLSSSSTVVAVKCLVLPCPHSGGFVLVITG